MSYVGDCEFCDGPVDHHHAAHPVSGWEKLRGQGGANRIIGRKRDTTRVAHSRCAEFAAEQERQGIHPSQGILG